jgi:glyoxalase superfamily protein
MASHLRVGSIVTDCVEFDKMMAFWREALRYAPKYPPERGWVILRDPQGRGPNISLNRVRKKTPGRNNLHLDLYSDDREREVDRLVEAGAKRHRQSYDPGDDFRVLEDPDGNLFCVVQLPKGST